jgi:hypothetical protein
MPKIICPQCAHPTQESDRFCRKCGSDLGTLAATAKPIPEAQPGQAQEAKPTSVRLALQRIILASLFVGIASSFLNSWLHIDFLAWVWQLAFLCALLSTIALIVFNRWQRNKKQTALILLAAGVILAGGFTYLAVTRDRLTHEQIEWLSSPSSQLRSSAAYELGGRKVKSAVEPLIDALQDEDKSVRSAAASALGDIGDERAVEPLLKALEIEDFDVRMAIIYSLGRLGDERAVAPLIELLWDETAGLQEASARALGMLGEPVVEPLTTALAAPTNQRYFAAIALGEIDDRQAAESLEARFEQGDTLVIAGAHKFFINQGKPGTEDQLIQALYDYGDVAMATTYLNCGNVKLQKAAETWAANYGYTIYASPGGSGSAAWGSNR